MLIINIILIENSTIQNLYFKPKLSIPIYPTLQMGQILLIYLWSFLDPSNGHFLISLTFVDNAFNEVAHILNIASGSSSHS